MDGADAVLASSIEEGKGEAESKFTEDITYRRQKGRNDINQGLKHDDGSTRQEGVCRTQIEVQWPQVEPVLAKRRGAPVVLERDGFAANNRSGSAQDHNRQSETDPIDHSDPGEVYRFFLIGGVGWVERGRERGSGTHCKDGSRV